MAKKEGTEGCCTTGAGGCRIESLISVDERGQMVMPKELRERADIKPGDKLAVISWEKKGRVCCISLVKTEEITDMIKGFLGPMLQDLMEK